MYANDEQLVSMIYQNPLDGILLSFIR